MGMCGFISILVMDVWEYLSLLDYKPSGKATSMEAFFSNVIWESVEKRLQLCGRMTKRP
jgi:superoxide dismutase